MEESHIQSIHELLTKAQSVLVIIGPRVNYDILSAATSLYLSLSSQPNKELSLLCPDLKKIKSETLIGFDQLKDKLGNKNLVVSFDYNEAAVDKVSYQIDDEAQKFYLTIRPQKGKKPLDSSKVECFYNGVEADLIFVLGVETLESLGNLYKSHEQLYQGATVVNVYKSQANFGDFKIDTEKFSSFSETIANLIAKLKLNLSFDAASNLLAGIESSSKGFSTSNTTANTFEMVASLMRAGGKRRKRVIKKEKEEFKTKKREIPAHKEISSKKTIKFTKTKPNSKKLGHFPGPKFYK